MMRSLLALLALLACTEHVTGPAEYAEQRYHGAWSWCAWEIVLPAGMALESGAYDVDSREHQLKGVALSDRQAAAIRGARAVRFWAETHAPFTIDLRLHLRADTTYLASYPTLQCGS